MGEFFKGWKRKLACATLAFSLLLTVMWVFSQGLLHIVEFQTGALCWQRWTVLDGKVTLTLDTHGEVRRGRIWNWLEVTPSARGADRNTVYEWRFCGFSCHHFVQDPAKRYWTGSILAVELPLLMLSGHVLLSMPAGNSDNPCPVHEFLRPLRRRLGLLVLVVACGVMVLCMRSLVKPQWYQGAITDSTNEGVLSLGGNLICNQIRAKLNGSGLPIVGVTDGTFQSIVFQQSNNDDPFVKVRPNWNICGIKNRVFETATFTLTTLTIPYWSIVLPLALLSAWLMLVAPRTRAKLQPAPQRNANRDCHATRANDSPLLMPSRDARKPSMADSRSTHARRLLPISIMARPDGIQFGNQISNRQPRTAFHLA